MNIQKLSTQKNVMMLQKINQTELKVELGMLTLKCCDYFYRTARHCWALKVKRSKHENLRNIQAPKVCHYERMRITISHKRMAATHLNYIAVHPIRDANFH